jgi:aminomethyltransferase
MPVPTPFFERTRELCRSYLWKDWAGYLAVCRYDKTLDVEYSAFRQSAGLLDVTPLYKYEVHGPDAIPFLSRVMVRSISKLSPGRVAYTCWCDDSGKVIDDGTVARLDENHFRVTSALPAQGWLTRLSLRYDVSIEDSGKEIAALALQGPLSREILRQCVDIDIDSLKYFDVAFTQIEGFGVWLSRTGYTGDLGFEIWADNQNALELWDTLMAVGSPLGILPVGLDALDMTRIEAAYLLSGVDYFSSTRVVLESQKSSPFEIGLGWMVNVHGEPFVGQAALAAEKGRGSSKCLVGLEVAWEELETLYESYGLPPDLPASASREPIPVYLGTRQVGQITSHTWSPLLKKSIALATVEASLGKLGTELKVEHTVEFERRKVTAHVVRRPFFDPERKRTP